MAAGSTLDVSRKRLPSTLWAWPLGLLLALGACGGGGAGNNAPGSETTAPPDTRLPGTWLDPVNYSALAGASLPQAQEAAAITAHTLTLNGQRLNYTARAGHLSAKSKPSGQDQASLFYVAYTLDQQALGARPITFFYNGGPGSASVWLHLGSYGPKRLATGMPSTQQARPYALVDNAESLLDISDLVFVNAVGSGYSQAVAPFVNRSFWGVDADAALFRDFIARFVEVYGRQDSPKYLFGESYGGPRTAVLAGLLEAAGLRLSGLILQSPALNYNSNCAILAEPSQGCEGFLPSYAATGQHYRKTQPPDVELGAWMAQMRDFSVQRYQPALAAVFGGGAWPAEMPALLEAQTGLAQTVWQQHFNLQPDVFRVQLMPGQLLGRYDARVSVPVGSELAREGDPSSSILTASFAGAIRSYLRDTLRYLNDSTYVLFSNAIESWDFRHAGKDMPDTIPDLGAALALNPQLKVLVLNGYHDLATPFYQTELDLARLNLPARVLVRNYAGGHMSYLDDAARVASKADLQAFYQGRLSGPQILSPMQPRNQLQIQALTPSPGAPSVAAFTPSLAPMSVAAPVPGPLVDPWVPPSRRPSVLVQPQASQGQVLQREIQARLMDLRQRASSE